MRPDEPSSWFDTAEKFKILLYFCQLWAWHDSPRVRQRGLHATRGNRKPLCLYPQSVCRALWQEERNLGCTSKALLFPIRPRMWVWLIFPTKTTKWRGYQRVGHFIFVFYDCLNRIPYTTEMYYIVVLETINMSLRWSLCSFLLIPLPWASKWPSSPCITWYFLCCLCPNLFW